MLRVIKNVIAFDYNIPQVQSQIPQFVASAYST